MSPLSGWIVLAIVLTAAALILLNSAREARRINRDYETRKTQILTDHETSQQS